MYSHWSESSNRRHYSDRSSRQSEDYDDRWEERRESQRETEQNTYSKYGGDGHTSSVRSREYSDSPTRLFRRHSLDRGEDRRSPVRRGTSSSDWAASENKRRRYTDDDDDDDNYVYRCEPEDITIGDRQSPESLSLSHVTSDYKSTLPLEDHFENSRKSQDTVHRYQQEDFTYGQQHNDATDGRSAGYYEHREDDENCWDYSQERGRSQDQSTKGYAKPRERDDSPATDREGHHLDKARISMNGSEQSFESDATNQGAAAPVQTRSERGFQRFLDVLNKGVNVAMLTKMVTQMSPEPGDQSYTPTSFVNTGEHLCSPAHSERQQETHQNTSYWSERQQSQRQASPQPCHRSVSPKRRSLSDDISLPMDNQEQSFFSSNSSSEQQVEKVALTPRDEHEQKHRQVQVVLQAIGMNLGFEELGQMSQRIQERLYGKQNGVMDHDHKESRERHNRRVYSPKLRSRSSSSRSSSSPPPQDYYTKKDAHSVQKDATEVQQAADSSISSSSGALEDTEKSEINSQQSSAACSTFPQKPTYTMSRSSTRPALPMYSPVNHPSLQYSARAPSLAPALPPWWSSVVPRFFPPRKPPLLPMPNVPPINIFQQRYSSALLAQTRNLLPQHVFYPQPMPFINMPRVNTIQPINNAKPKTLSRPRCLQVIKTNLPS